jgi:hypothetical protein
MTSRAGPQPDPYHPVGAVLRAAVRGQFPQDDGSVAVVAPWRDGVEAVVSFTAHAVAATTLPLERLQAVGFDAYSGCFAPAVLRELAGPGGIVDSLDVVLGATGTGRTGLPERPDLAGHPRVRHAAGWRSDVHVHADPRGLVTVSRGLGGLAELSFEVPPERAVAGTGRSLLADGRGLVPLGEPVLVLVAPGNARSLRAALAAGFVPLGAAQLVRPGRRG